MIFNWFSKYLCFIILQEVLDFMQEHHLVPDLITFGCLALGCHRLHDAKNFLKDMDSLGFRLVMKDVIPCFFLLLVYIKLFSCI